jgi:FkbH-like protein
VKWDNSEIRIEMRLGEALQIIGRSGGEQKIRIHLLCSFTPLHLKTFIKGYLIMRFPDATVDVRTGLYGDLEGNIQRARENGGDGAIAIIEWSDLDQRLGFRASGGWRTEKLEDIIAHVDEKCQRIEQRLIELAGAMPVVLVGPSLGLPPLTHVPPAQTSSSELRLNAILAQFLQRVCAHDRIRLVSGASLALNSPYAARHDIKMDLLIGFSYTVTHADSVAKLSVDCLFPVASKKGLITDLDQTLWKGILGEDGVDGVSWSLEGKSHAHALYQQLLASLADSGVLVAIASKNDAELVKTALARSDMLVQPSQIFPVEVSWGAKSDAVERILETWNIAAESVVYVDDSPMELAEVSEKYPGIECLAFPSNDPAAILTLLHQLRLRFGKSEVREEDRLRLQSIRASTVLRQEKTAVASADFVARLEGKLTFEPSGSDKRAFELVNKTNQFNLNGVRYTETGWKSLSMRPGAFLGTVSYEDRFGPLGRIAVLGGYRKGGLCHVDIWVMSCRAFSRHIEFQSIRQLFNKTHASEIRFRFAPTDRNGPLQDFLIHFSNGGLPSGEELRLRYEDFDSLCPLLFHEVNDKWTMSETD